MPTCNLGLTHCSGDLEQVTFTKCRENQTKSVADPGFPMGGGRGPRRRGCGLLRQLCFENFVCQNERIGTLRGGMCRVCPLDLPMQIITIDDYFEDLIF